MPPTMLCWTVFLLVQAFFAKGQDFSVPSNWLNTTSQVGRAERISLAQSGLGRVREAFNTTSGQFIDFEYWESPSVLAAFAFKDYVAGTKDNTFVVDGLIAADRQDTAFSGAWCWFVNVPPLWAMACIYGYRAYGETPLLSLAENVWTETSKWVITASNVQSGSHTEKTPKFSGTCNGKSLEGGIFYSAYDQNDMRITSITTALHVMVSAHLAELTKETKYRDAAILSAKFMQAHMITASDLVIDSVTASASGNCNRDETLHSVYAGWVFEGFSVLADVTSDSSWRNAAMNVLASATHYGVWADADGVVRDDSKDGFIRSFYEPYKRNENNATVRNFVQSYLNVQYNALMTYGTTSGSNLYAADWHAGPPPTSLTPAGVVSTMSLLGIGIVGADSPTSSSSISASSTSTSEPGRSTSAIPTTSDPKKKTNVAAIAAGVAAPLAILLIALIAFFLWRRRRRQTQPRPSSVLPRDDFDDKVVATPGIQGHVPQMPWSPGSPQSVDPPPVDHRYAASQAALEASWAAPSNSSGAGIKTISATPPSSAAALMWQGQQPVSATTAPMGSGTRPPASFSSAREEKRALQSAMLANVRTNGASASSAGPSSATSLGAPGQSAAGGTRMYEDLPTDELVRVLNQRLQAGPAGDEVPPGYEEVGRR